MRALRLVVISSLYCSLTYGQLITSPEAVTLTDSISTLRACVSYCLVDLLGGIGCDVNSWLQVSLYPLSLPILDGNNI